MATAEQLRRQREQASIFSRIYDAAAAQRAALASEGRRPVLGGLLSKEPVQGVDTLRYEGVGNMLMGLLDPAARAIDAPAAAARGQIPREDMLAEALGTAGFAMLGGGAVAKPAGSLGANALRVYHGTDADISQLQSGYGRTARDLYTTPIKDDAAVYGKNVLEFDVDGKIGNFLPDNRGIKEVKILSKAYKDYGLDDYFDSFDDFVDALDSGDMYQRTGSSAAQDEVVGALIDAGGFDAIRIPDAGFGGPMSESVVAQNPDVFKPVMANASKSAGLASMIGFDNPKGDWLAGKVRRAEQNIAEGGKGIVGPTTAYTKQSVMLPIDQLSTLKGAMDEMPRAGQPKYDDLMQSMRSEGFRNDSPVLIGVNHRGEPYIVEGNNRVAVAREMGIDKIPVEVRWYNGGEDAAQNWSPQSVQDMAMANASAPIGILPLQSGDNEQKVRSYLRQRGLLD